MIKGYLLDPSEIKIDIEKIDTNYIATASILVDKKIISVQSDCYYDVEYAVEEAIDELQWKVYYHKVMNNTLNKGE